MIQLTTKLIDKGTDTWRNGYTFSFTKPTNHELLVGLMDLFAEAEAKCAGYISLRLELPHRPRTTGDRSQNNRFYGHCADIAEQVLGIDGKPQYNKEQIHDAMLRMTVSEGYPTYLDLNGIETPLPSAQASLEQMKLVDRVMQRYADIHGFWLHEYVEEGPHKGEIYRSIGGRSFDEMQNMDLGVRLIEESKEESNE